MKSGHPLKKQGCRQAGAQGIHNGGGSSRPRLLSEEQARRVSVPRLLERRDVRVWGLLPPSPLPE